MRVVFAALFASALASAIVEDPTSVADRAALEAKYEALERKFAELESHQSHQKPFVNVRGSAGFTRAGPGAGRVGNHGLPKDPKVLDSYRRRLMQIGHTVDAEGRTLSEGRKLSEVPAAPPSTPPPAPPSAPPVPPVAVLFAQINDNTAGVADAETSVDHTWILLAGLLCWFLQGGFALLEAGAVRAKNAKNIALKNTMDACIGGVVYYCFGYGLAYGGPGDGTGNVFAGGEDTPYFMLSGDGLTNGVHMGEFYGFFFQYVFAATIATIVSGAVAERITFMAYMIYAAVLTGFIYPICSHWIWSGDGFLNKMGVIDYAGGGAVHALSGVAAFMGAAALGPRIGRFDDNGKPVEIKSHNASMMAFGLFVLWFGFIPFNAGSGVSVLGWMAGQTGRIAVMTTMGGCSGGVTALIYGLMPPKVGGVGYPSLEYSINGVLSGMVAVCGCCAVVPIWSVFWFISPIAVASFFINQNINKRLKVDDPLGASSLHFGPGIVGVIMVGFFATDELTSNAYGYTYGEYRVDKDEDGNAIPGNKDDYIGVFFGGNGTQLGYQLAACMIYTVYGAVTCGILFFSMKFAGILRVPPEDEKVGLDVTHHGGPAYIWDDEAPTIKKDPADASTA